MASQVASEDQSPVEPTVFDTHFYVRYDLKPTGDVVTALKKKLGVKFVNKELPLLLKEAPQHNSDPLDLTATQFKEHAQKPFPTHNSPKAVGEGQTARSPAVVLCTRKDALTGREELCILTQVLDKDNKAVDGTFGIKCYTEKTPTCRSSDDLTLIDKRVLPDVHVARPVISSAPSAQAKSPPPMGEGGQSNRLGTAPAAGAAPVAAAASAAGAAPVAGAASAAGAAPVAGAASAAAAVPVADSASSDPSSSSSEGSPVYGSQGIVNRRGNLGGKPQQPSGPMPPRSRITFAEGTNESDGSYSNKKRCWVSDNEDDSEDVGVSAPVAPLANKPTPRGAQARPALGVSPAPRPAWSASPAPRPAWGASPEPRPVAGPSPPVGEIRRLQARIAELEEQVDDQDVRIAELQSLLEHPDINNLRTFLETGKRRIVDPTDDSRLKYRRVVLEFAQDPAPVRRPKAEVYKSIPDVLYAIQFQETSGESQGYHGSEKDARGSSYRQVQGKPRNFDPRSNERCKGWLPVNNDDEDDDEFKPMPRGRHALGRV